MGHPTGLAKLLMSDEGSESASLLQDYDETQFEKCPDLHGDSKNAAIHHPRSSRSRSCRPSLSWFSSTVCHVMLSTLGVFLLITVGFLGSLLMKEPPTQDGPHAEAPTICQTAECVHAASEILSNMDPNHADIDPCTDFDQYVCGGWREQHDMRPDQGAIFSGTFMQEVSQTRLRHLLEASEPSNPDDLNIFKKLKAAYTACLDEETVNRRGKQPLNSMLEELEGVYSSGSASEGSEAGLTDAVLYLTKSGVRALVGAFVSPDDRDPDTVVVFVTPPRRIGLPAREYYNDTKTVTDYTTVVEKVLGGFVDDGKLKQHVADVIAFESKLANVTPDTQTQEDVTKYYNPRTLGETQSLLPQVSLSDIISDLAPLDYKADRLIVGSPSYMESLSKIIKETPRETIQLFFKWKIIQAYAEHIEDPVIKPLREFNNVLAGKDPQAKKDRWRKCISTLDSDLGWILSRFYVLSAFSEESKKLGDQIVSDIKDRFVYTLDQTGWMSPEVRKLGIQKVGNIVQKIGYPTKSPDVMDPVDVEKYYRSLSISNDTFFENGVAVAKFDVEKDWSKLGKPTDRNEWGMTAPTVNAYYNPPGNEIVFPAGIMQPPVFYGPATPLYLAYGAFGAVSGHELSHAFDSTGRHYDETGNYTDWWDEKTVKSFTERAQCFVDQYAEFTVPGKDSEPLHVNGRLTLGENIADAGGLAAAYHAWKKRDEAHPDPQLPGLSAFSKEQLFFMSFANWWCSKTTPEAAQEAIYNDPHAPKPARITGTMANSLEFQEAFNCPNKKATCKLW
ncbi:M13 family metallopeptidase [Aspergillus lucknowensis]|uniref:Endothelin-converting enzyme n=1 Tax=Aspergillus lucknowensis TaxID=176173 RepID=A0ABR4LGX1_9EURO